MAQRDFHVRAFEPQLLLCFVQVLGAWSPRVLKICTTAAPDRSNPSKHTLRTPHLPLPPVDPRTSHPTRPGQSLERTFRPMMVITSPNHIHMQRHPRRHRPAAQPMMYHLTIQLSNHGSLKVEIADEEGARGYVEDGAGESFVEGSVAVTEAGEAGAGA